jgi:hypothetical protein
LIYIKAHPDYGTYKLQTLAGEPLNSLVHVDRLRPARGDRPDKPWYNPTQARYEYNSVMKDTALNNSVTMPIEDAINYDQVLDPVDHIDPLQRTENTVEEDLPIGELVTQNNEPATDTLITKDSLESQSEPTSSILVNPSSVSSALSNEPSAVKTAVKL